MDKPDSGAAPAPGKTDYELYIRTDELFGLLPAPEKLRAQDELLFMVTHQTAELWMQVCLHDVACAVAHADRDELTRATELFARVARIEAHLTRQLEILENMPPMHYVHIRRGLGRGSGQESPGFKLMLKMGETIWPAVERLLERRAVALVDVLYAPETHAELHAFLRALFELDQWFRSWRFAHFRLVERQIGGFVHSLKGVPAEQLVHGMREHLMPDLWAAVNDLTRRVNAEDGKPSY